MLYTLRNLNKLFLCFIKKEASSFCYSSYNGCADSIQVNFGVCESRYCIFGNFREKFIFANSVKRHICNIKISQYGHEIPISVNDRVISRMFSFHENKPSRKFPSLQYLTSSLTLKADESINSQALQILRDLFGLCNLGQQCRPSLASHPITTCFLDDIRLSITHTNQQRGSQCPCSVGPHIVVSYHKSILGGVSDIRPNRYGLQFFTLPQVHLYLDLMLLPNFSRGICKYTIFYHMSDITPCN